MRRRIPLLWAFFMLTFFLLGCAGESKELKLKCPKCGSFFTTKEGAQEYEWMMRK